MEAWVKINWFEYEISNMWNIRSLDKSQKQKNRWWQETIYSKKWKLLKPWKKHHWYMCVFLCKNWVRNVRMIHRLVAEAFLWLDISNASIQVWHKDNDPTNNTVSNLYLTTHRENEDYKMLCWRTAYWERNAKARLTEEQVLSIYKEYKEWNRIVDIEKKYQHKWISDIVKWINWKYLYHHFLSYDNQTNTTN